MSTGKFGMKFKLGGPDGGPVEIDQTFVGGRVQNMHKSKRIEMQRIRGEQNETNYLNKTIVHGSLDRDLRQVRASVIPNVRRETLQNQILKEIKLGTKVYSDDASAYSGVIPHKFVHEVVSHIEEYVRGEVHTNRIENFWSLLKRCPQGYLRRGRARITLQR